MDICCTGKNLNINPVGGQGMNIGPAAHHNEFINSKIHDLTLALDDQGGGNCCQSSHGGYIMGYSNLFDGLEIYNVGQDGVQFYHYGDQSTVHNNVIRNSIIHDTGLSGLGNSECIDFQGSSHQAYNNVCYNSPQGIGVGGQGLHIVYNNTFFAIGTWAIYLPTNGHIIKNNIVSKSVQYILIDGTATVSNNLCDVAGSNCSIVANPLFIAPSPPDFHLQSGSRAIGAGTNSIASGITVNSDGSAPNIGAY